MSGRRRGGRGRRRRNTVWTAERPCAPTHVRRRTHSKSRGTQTSFHAHAGACDAQTGRLGEGGDLIMVTPIEDQQHSNGRLWVPGEMSIQNSDTHLVATSLPISGARHSTRCLCQRPTPPLPLYSPPPREAAASAK